MIKRLKDIISSSKGSSTIEYVIILMAGVLLATILLNVFSEDNDITRALQNKVKQTLMGEVSSPEDNGSNSDHNGAILSSGDNTAQDDGIEIVTKWDKDKKTYNELIYSPSNDPPTLGELGKATYSSSIIGITPLDHDDETDSTNSWWKEFGEESADYFGDIIDEVFERPKLDIKSLAKWTLTRNPFTIVGSAYLEGEPAGETQGEIDSALDRGSCKSCEDEDAGNQKQDKNFSSLKPGDPDFSYDIVDSEYANGDIKKVAETSDDREIPLVNSKYAGKLHNGVYYNDDGFPVFDEWTVAEINIPDEKVVGKSPKQLALATELFKQKYPDWETRFDLPEKTKQDIRKGKGSPKDYTWHHHQDTGRMQLIPRDVHESARHTGGHAIWGKQSETSDEIDDINKKKKKKKK
ncbi:HNH endonuclease [Mechercharimyces sp. CAU 1602]|uniref:HNH endonuclease n=1 Tax=Mechercharimyces sp. CAU 1602 TaxID=2973933 RepID=UPI0021630090|nr:HNH endonuclease [Mechercharimyces sp. CAU 1602]MCS1351166.1 HNH endonuclease [Mechercharimyces sp. CAU 1602]